MEIQPIGIMLKNSKTYLINLGRNSRIPDSGIESFHVFFSATRTVRAFPVESDLELESMTDSDD